MTLGENSCPDLSGKRAIFVGSHTELDIGWSVHVCTTFEQVVKDRDRLSYGSITCCMVVDFAATICCNVSDREGSIRQFPLVLARPQKCRGMVPVGRNPWPPKVANLVVYLPSDQASFITVQAWELTSALDQRWARVREPHNMAERKKHG